MHHGTAAVAIAVANEFASSISAFSALIRSAFFRGQVRLEAFGLRHLLDTIETTRRCSDR
jgi:hypothetical protein